MIPVQVVHYTNILVLVTVLIEAEWDGGMVCATKKRS